MKEEQSKAKLSNLRQSPRKVRLVADLIRGKKVEEALQILKFTNKRSITPMEKLLMSAIANAKDRGIGDEGNLIVQSIRVDEGPILYRRRPVSRGRANVIRKRTSHINISLSPLENIVLNK